MNDCTAAGIGAALFIGMLFGLLGGWAVTTSDWQQDCIALGKHRAGGEVWLCSKVNKTEGQK